MRTIRGAVFGGGLVFAAALAVASHSQSARVQQKPIPEIKEVPCVAILSIEGKDNFGAYCAVCHGNDAKGGGPAAVAMKAPVPDLTTIARRHGGKFDFAAVEYVVRGTGRTPVAAHGTKDMPVWGPALQSAVGDPGATTLRIKNLVRYLESIQEGKPATMPRS